MLQQFDFDVAHRKGSENKMADSLSRMYEDSEEGEFHPCTAKQLQESEQASFVIFPSYDHEGDPTEFSRF